MKISGSYGNLRACASQLFSWPLHLFLWLILPAVSFSQNIAPNPSFENYTSCPVNFNSGQPLQAVPWTNPTPGTADYFNECDNPGPVGVPQNGLGYQPARTGGGYCGLYTHTTNGNYREYLQAPLTTPMVAGITYHVSFYVSLADIYCGTYNMAAYFSATPPPFNGTNPIDVQPQIVSHLGYLDDAINWTLISGCFVAQGGETFITIGNFEPISDTPIDPNCAASQAYSYYYIDDVEVIAGEPGETIDFDLGDAVSQCTEYEIAPSISGVGYLWENGSDETTLSVSESGIYNLTITDGCNVGMDSLEVTILGSSTPVDVGPADVTICHGEVYEINLDPQWNYNWDNGSTSSDFQITDEGNYQVTMNDGCDESTDAITVHLLEPPAPFTLGPDAHICPGENIEYDFDPSLGSFQWQDNSSSPNYSITTAGIYTLHIYNMCGLQIDQIAVTATPDPVVNLGPSQLSICEGTNLAISLDPEIGSYIWQDGLISPTYTISNPGEYSVTVYNQCGSAADAISVTLIAAPEIELSSDTLLCPFQFPFNIDASQASNATAFVWQDGSTNSSFTALNAGAYSVTVSNACATVTDTIVIQAADDSPDVTLPDDINLCPGTPYVLYNSGSTGNYLWQDGSTSDSLLVGNSGLYAVTISNGCGAGSDSVWINYIPPVPLPGLGPDFALCSGVQFILSPGIHGVNYVWQDMSTADTLLVTTAGIYSVAISDACSSATDTIEITENNLPPQIDLPSQISLCRGDHYTIDASLPGVSFLWNDGSDMSTLLVTTPGAYSVTVSNLCGVDQDTLTVLDGGDAPSIELGNDLSLCPGETVSIIPAYAHVNNWLWSNGSSDSTYLISGGEQISVQVSNACGNARDTLMTILLPAVPLLTLGNDTALCPGQSVLLTIPSTDVSIVWSDGTTNPNFLLNTPGTFSVAISNSCGVSTDTVVVRGLPAAPDLNLGIDQSLCPGETIIISPGIADVSYQWQDGSGNTSFQTTGEGMIVLKISNACGYAIDTMQVIESTAGPQVNLGPDISACTGEQVILNSDISGVDYLWQNGTVDPSFVTSSPGTFILQVSNNCGADADTIQVDFLKAPEPFTIGPDTTLCPGQTMILTAPAIPGQVQWQDGSHGASLLANQTQLYTLLVSNQCGDSYDEMQLTYDERIPVVQLAPILNWCPGEIIDLDVTQSFPAAYLWNTASISPMIQIDAPGVYSVHILTACQDVTGSIHVIVADTCTTENSIYIPNIFSPNGDLANDVFTVSMNEKMDIRAIEMSIFDRWGNMVYHTGATPVRWSGDYNGVLLDQGVYVYKLEVRYIDQMAERRVTLDGDITLIR